MASSTPFFKAFGPLLFGRRSKSALDSISKLESLEDLYAIFGEMFAAKLLERSEKGANSRQRSLPPHVTFWAFVAQALSPKSSCREVVRRVEAWWRWGQLRSRKRDRHIWLSRRVKSEPAPYRIWASPVRAYDPTPGRWLDRDPLPTK